MTSDLKSNMISGNHPSIVPTIAVQNKVPNDLLRAVVIYLEFKLSPVDKFQFRGLRQAIHISVRSETYLRPQSWLNLFRGSSIPTTQPAQRRDSPQEVPGIVLVRPILQDLKVIYEAIKQLRTTTPHIAYQL